MASLAAIVSAGSVLGDSTLAYDGKTCRALVVALKRRGWPQVCLENRASLNQGH